MALPAAERQLPRPRHVITRDTTLLPAPSAGSHARSLLFAVPQIPGLFFNGWVLGS